MKYIPKVLRSMLSKIKATHNSTLLTIFFILIISAIVCLVFAGISVATSFLISQKNFEYNNQPSTNTSNSKTWKTITSKTNFDILGVIFPSYLVTVDCVVNSTNFVQNNPSTITVSLSFSPNCWNDLDIEVIEVQPVNALIGSPDWHSNNTYDSIGFSDFFLYQVDNIGANQVWSGSDGFGFPVFFQDSGLINLKIKIYASPSQMTWERYNGTYATLDDPVFYRLWNFNNTFTTAITLPIYIESSERVQIREAQELWQDAMLNQQKQIQTQQEISGYWNLALALFITALTLFDLAIVVFDHSVNKESIAETQDSDTNTKEENQQECNYTM